MTQYAFPDDSKIPLNCDECGCRIASCGYVSAFGVFDTPHSRCDECRWYGEHYQNFCEQMRQGAWCHFFGSTIDLIPRCVIL